MFIRVVSCFLFVAGRVVVHMLGWLDAMLLEEGPQLVRIAPPARQLDGALIIQIARVHIRSVRHEQLNGVEAARLRG